MKPKEVTGKNDRISQNRILNHRAKIIEYKYEKSIKPLMNGSYIDNIDLWYKITNPTICNPEYTAGILKCTKLRCYKLISSEIDNNN